MKVIFVILLSLFSTLQISAQAYKDSIRSQFMEYTRLLIQKDFAGSVEYVNTEFLKIIPKEKLVAIMEQTMNNPEIDIQLTTPTIVSMDDNVVINKMEYVRFTYTGMLGMRFLPESGLGTDTAQTKAALEGQFGKENVQFDYASGFYNIQVVKQVIANSSNRKQWTFVVVEEKQKPLLKQFIPAELL